MKEKITIGFVIGFMILFIASMLTFFVAKTCSIWTPGLFWNNMIETACWVGLPSALGMMISIAALSDEF